MTCLEATGLVKSAPFDLAAAGNLVAAVAGKRIRLLGAVLIAGAAGATFAVQTKPAGAGTNLIPPVTMAANAYMVWNLGGIGWTETAVGQALYCNLSAGALKGVIRYQEIH